jgi:hypothetical protein
MPLEATQTNSVENSVIQPAGCGVYFGDPSQVSVVTTTLAEIYSGLSQSLHTNTKIAHQTLGHDHCHIVYQLLTIDLSHAT